MEKKSIEDKSRMMTMAGEDEICKLQRVLQLKDKETNKIDLKVKYKEIKVNSNDFNLSSKIDEIEVTWTVS